MNRKSCLLVAGLVLSPLMGCQSQLTGGEGNLVFSYTADDSITDFNKAIAVGAKLEVSVRDAATRRAVDLDEVVSQNEDALSVESFAQNRFILNGIAEGNSQIDVEATLAGEAITDFVNMRSAEATKIELNHSCKEIGDSDALYLAGSTNVWIPFDLKDSDNRPVIGYGLFPIDVEESVTLDRSSTDQTFFHVSLAETPGATTITSTIDDTALNMEVVAEAAINGAEMNPASVAQRVIADETHVFHIWPTVDDERLCQAELDTSVESLTPEICEVSMVEETIGLLSVNEVGFVSLKGLAQGACEFELTYTGGNAGAGTNTTFTVDIAAFAENPDI